MPKEKTTKGTPRFYLKLEKAADIAGENNIGFVTGCSLRLSKSKVTNEMTAKYYTSTFNL